MLYDKITSSPFRGDADGKMQEAKVKRGRRTRIESFFDGMCSFIPVTTGKRGLVIQDFCIVIMQCLTWTGKNGCAFLKIISLFESAGMN